MGSICSFCFKLDPSMLQYVAVNKQEDRNYLFFMNEIRCEPNGDYINEIHRTWYLDFPRLENDHGFIQWLFPITDKGMNPSAPALTLRELEMIRSSETAQMRLLISYKMMLNFYGIELEDEESGRCCRAPHWKAGFKNLNLNKHNNLRITRIIRSICLLGYERLAPPFVEFLATEIFRHKTLVSCSNSCLQYWIPALNHEHQLRVQQYVNSLLGDAMIEP